MKSILLFLSIFISIPFTYALSPQAIEGTWQVEKIYCEDSGYVLKTAQPSDEIVSSLTFLKDQKFIAEHSGIPTADPNVNCDISFNGSYTINNQWLTITLDQQTNSCAGTQKINVKNPPVEIEVLGDNTFKMLLTNEGSNSFEGCAQGERQVQVLSRQ